MKSKVLVIFLFLLVAVTIVSAGEMDDWAYRKQITLSNSGNALTDYQVMFTVYRSTGTDSGTTVYVGTKCQEDYDDIRFTDTSGTVLSYWIESSDSSSATIWVKFPSIPAGSSTWYLYYGNASATAVSNGDATFQFFDDFPGTTLDTSKWNTPGGGTVTISGGVLNWYLPKGAGENSIISKALISGDGYAILSRCRAVTSLYGHNSGVSIRCNTNAKNQGLYFDSAASNPPVKLIETSVVAGTTILSSTSIGTWYILEATAIGNTMYGRVNYSTWGSWSRTALSGNFGIHAAEWSGSINYTAEFDWVAIRKYISTEPTVSAWGSEETALPIVTPDFSATPITGESPLTVYFSDASTGCTTWPNSSINIDYWEWDFGDGSPKNYQQNPAHTYTQTGYFNVSLKSGNLTYGEYNTTIKNNYINVVVNPNVPVAEFTATPTCANTGTTIYFIDYSTGGGLYAWNWSFGDGTYSTLRNPTHQYAANGTYNVSMTVWGAYGSDTETKTGYIQIPCPTPTPTPTPSPTPIPSPTGTPPIQGEIPQARIPVLGFMVLAWVDLGLILYTFIDNENRNYMHVYSAVIAVILSFLLAVSLTNGFITDAHVLTDKEVTVNSSVLSTHLVEHIAVTDTGWSWFFAFLGVMMLIISVLSAIEAVRENTEEVM